MKGDEEMSCPYKLEPLKDRLARLTDGAFIVYLIDYERNEFSEWDKTTEILNKETDRRNLTFQAGNLLLGYKKEV
jgi:hypothetical protein